MLRSLNLAVILLLVALVPARAISSVTLMVCTSNLQRSAAHQHESAEQGGHAEHRKDHGGTQSPGDAGHACGYCATHCAGVAFAVPTDPLRVAPSAGTDRIPFGVWAIPNYRPSLLDRPPLVS